MLLGLFKKKQPDKKEIRRKVLTDKLREIKFKKQMADNVFNNAIEDQEIEAAIKLQDEIREEEKQVYRAIKYIAALEKGLYNDL